MHTKHFIEKMNELGITCKWSPVTNELLLFEADSQIASVEMDKTNTFNLSLAHINDIDSLILETDFTTVLKIFVTTDPEIRYTAAEDLEGLEQL